MSPARAGTTAVLGVLGAAGLLLVLVTWAASIGPDRVVDSTPASHLTPTEPPGTGPPTYLDRSHQAGGRHEASSGHIGWVRTVALLVEGLTVLVALYLLGLGVRRAAERWRTRGQPEHSPPTVDFSVVGSPSDVAEAIEADAAEQLALLDAGDPSDAILACWARFEVQAARARHGRRTWETSSEFVLRILDYVGADSGAVERLRQLYCEARFSDHRLGEAERADARAALQRVHISMRATGPVR